MRGCGICVFVYGMWYGIWILWLYWFIVLLCVSGIKEFVYLGLYVLLKYSVKCIRFIVSVCYVCIVLHI